MLTVFDVRRWNDRFTVNVSHEGMVFVSSHLPLGQKDPVITTLHVTEVPEAFIRSSKTALGGYKGWHDCFMIQTSDGFLDGRFGARSGSDEWIDFFYTLDHKSIQLILRKREVEKLVMKLEQYWNIS